MRFLKKQPVIVLATVALLYSCGANIDTGRNADPNQWPNSGKSDPNKKDPNATEDGSPDNQGKGPGGKNGPVGASIDCFQAETKQFPDGFADFCEKTVKPIPAFAKLHAIVCQQGKLLPALSHGECGWDGNPKTMMRHVQHYYIQPDPNIDYEDIHASLIHSPASIQKFMNSMRLVFEDYDQFKKLGMKWITGTREQRNLTGKKWEEGVDYRFRADKGEFEIGYHGLIKIYQINPKLFIHLNYAVDDFARITGFSQISFYQQLDDGSSLNFKLENRNISSSGLYERAKSSALELIQDVMVKGYNNANM